MVTKPKNCLIIAGEKSGEDHAMTFLPEIQKQLPDFHFYGVGGDRFRDIGVELLYHTKDFSGIGLSEVAAKIPFYFKALANIVSEVDKRETKTAILIDFQGFNLKLAKKLKKKGVRVLYYVAPQAWVWKPWRARVLEKNVHTLFTILPFEKKWFQQRGVSKVKSVRHPLVVEHAEKLKNVKRKSFAEFQKRAPKILILPGSRNVEVATLLPIFLKGIELLEEDGISVELGIVKTETVKPELYENISGIKNFWKPSEISEALAWADMSVAASGTVTLTTGLFQVPTVVCYKVSLFTEFVLGLLIPYKGFVSLTNIILGQKVFPEFINHHCNRYNVHRSLKEWIMSENHYESTLDELELLHPQLTGDEFSVSEYMSGVIQS